MRVGGHLEPGETCWECAAREAREETELTIEPIAPPAMLIVRPPFTDFRPFRWEGAEPRPLLLLPRTLEPDAPSNVMYLAQATGAPRPCNEVQGLLLLEPREVGVLCVQSTTLGEFLAAGGQALMRQPYPLGMTLEPGLQLRLLSRLITEGRL